VNKKLVYDYWREVIQAKDLAKTTVYMSADFKEHNPTVPGVGLQGFMDYFKGVFKSPNAVKPTVDNLIEMVAENDLVILVLRAERDDPGQPGKKYFTTWSHLLADAPMT
jgi:predicted SnoaL-like aldol condensation-catalyzing enzyme